MFGLGKYDDRIPTARIRANGTFSGSGGQGSRTLLFIGSFTGFGKTALLTFALPKQHCHLPQLKLSEQ